ncbi:MAG: 50S ribosomal protein L10 [Candidatus Pacebacteria bacterium]|nr:50S ribosomal protein L10 [Candidatus Paceibacterota bacterium]
MAITKQQKQEIVETINQKLQEQKSIFFIDFQGLGAKQLFELRNELKQEQAELYIAKKSLINIAFEKNKIPVKINEFKNQIGLVFGFDDEIIPAKIVYNIWKKYENPQILGGYYEKKSINAEKAIELAKLPSKKEMLAGAVGSIRAPLYNLVNALEYNIKGLIFILKQAKTQ